MPGSNILLRTPFHTIEAVTSRVIRLVRSSEAFPDAATVSQDFGQVVETLEDLVPQALLVDLRQAVGRNDPEFERASAPWRARLFTLTPRVAVLVRTAAGALQVRRHLAEIENGTPRVYLDPDEAWRELLDGAA